MSKPGQAKSALICVCPQITQIAPNRTQITFGKICVLRGLAGNDRLLTHREEMYRKVEKVEEFFSLIGLVANPHCGFTLGLMFF
jgi:hypothetical protein